MEKIIKKTMLLYTFFFLAFSNSFANEKANSFGSEKEAQRNVGTCNKNCRIQPNSCLCHDKRWPGRISRQRFISICVDNKGIMVAHPTLAGTDMSNFVSSDGVKLLN